MSYADSIFINVCRDILKDGFQDDDLPVRPRWPDGTPAHTVKKFDVVNRYDLAEKIQRYSFAQQPYMGRIGQ